MSEQQEPEGTTALTTTTTIAAATTTSTPPNPTSSLETAPPTTSQDEDDELEEGELKDDDDDEDDDDDDQLRNSSRVSNYDSDSDDTNRNNNHKPGDVDDEEDVGNENNSGSTKASSVSDSRSDLQSYHHSYSSRHSVSSQASPRSQHHRRHSSRNKSPRSNEQARLVSMRAKLLEARSREIEMKFQKNKSSVIVTNSAPISLICPGPARNVKTTTAKPPISYSENPNPISEEPESPPSESKRKTKRLKTSKHESKEKRSSKKSKKKRKKSSSSKKKKKTKTSQDKKVSAIEPKNTTSSEQEHSFVDSIDRQGPRTPPDNHVLTLDNEQIEWPSYLIRMTMTQPSISYSVNPNSVVEPISTERSDTADLNSDYGWYYNYFLNTLEMNQSQAQHQACSVIVSTGNYNDELLDKWLERKGFSKHSINEDEKESFPFFNKEEQADTDNQDNGKVPLRSIRPKFTTLKSQREIVLPNGKILPPGTIQKIVHPYPRTERVTPDIVSTFFDMF